MEPSQRRQSPMVITIGDNRRLNVIGNLFQVLISGKLKSKRCAMNEIGSVVAEPKDQPSYSLHDVYGRV